MSSRPWVSASSRAGSDAGPEPVPLVPTLLLLGLAIALGVFANWQERRPRPLGETPLVSYTLVQMLALVVVILMAAHLVSLLTGTPLKSRLGF